MENIDFRKVFVGIGALGLIGIGTMFGEQLFSKDNIQLANDQPEYVPVKLVVLNQQNDPIEGVDVQFIFEGSPAARITDTDGFVGIEIPKRDAVQVILRKKGFKTINRNLNLQIDPKTTITYQMEQVQ
jgi:hypothetical protein